MFLKCKFDLYPFKSWQIHVIDSILIKNILLYVFYPGTFEHAENVEVWPLRKLAQLWKFLANTKFEKSLRIKDV